MMTSQTSKHSIALKLVTGILVLSFAAPSLAQQTTPVQAPPSIPVERPWSIPSGTEVTSPKGLPEDAEIIARIDGEAAQSPYSGLWAATGGVAAYLSSVSLVFSVLRQFPALSEAENTLSRYERLMTPEDLEKDITKLEARRDVLRNQLGFTKQNPINVPSSGGTLDTLANGVPGIPSARKSAASTAAAAVKAEIELREVERKIAVLTKSFAEGTTVHTKATLQQELLNKVAVARYGQDYTVTVSQDFKRELVLEARAALRALRMQRLKDALISGIPGLNRGKWKKGTITATETTGVETEAGGFTKQTLIQATEEGGQKVLWSIRIVGGLVRVAIVIQGIRLVYDWFDNQPVPKLRSGERVQVPAAPEPATAQQEPAKTP